MAGVGGRANLPHAAATATDTRRCLHLPFASPLPPAASRLSKAPGAAGIPSRLRSGAGRPSERNKALFPSPHPPTVAAAAAAAAAMSPMETRALRVQMSYNFLQ